MKMILSYLKLYMNKYTIYAWLDDLQMSAYLAKLSTTHSYRLEFIDTIDQISVWRKLAVIIILMNKISELEMDQLNKIRQKQNFTCLLCIGCHLYFKNFFRHL